MAETVRTTKIQNFVKKLEKMMQNYEGKEREVIRDIVIHMRREFNLGYMVDGIYLRPKKFENDHIVLEDNIGGEYVIVNSRLLMYGKLDKTKKIDVKERDTIISEDLFEKVKRKLEDDDKE